MPNTKRTTDPAERFDAKVDRNGPLSPMGTRCWLWTATKLRKGYGSFWPGIGDNQERLAHRWSYVRAFGPIPNGMQVDHLCRNPSCVRPEHMEAVTPAINNARSASPTSLNAQATVCKFGHPLTPDNLHPCYTRMGQRRCWICVKQRQAEYRARKRKLNT